MKAQNISFRRVTGPSLRALYIDEQGKRFFLLEVAGFTNDPDEQSVAAVVEDDGHVEKVSVADGFVCIVQPDDCVLIELATGALIRSSTSPRILYYADKAQRGKAGV